MHKKDQGTLGEALVVAQIIDHEDSAFTQFGDNSPIDIVVESKNKLHKVQVKTVTRSENRPEVSDLLLYKNGPNYRFKYTRNQVEWFALVDKDTHKIAWIHADEALKQNTVSLRHTLPKNGQRNVRMFDAYTRYPFHNNEKEKEKVYVMPLTPKRVVTKRPEKPCKHFTKEQLQKLVNEYPLTKIGKQYKLSDNAIKRWVKKWGVTQPPRGYFLRKNVPEA